MVPDRGSGRRVLTILDVFVLLFDKRFAGFQCLTTERWELVQYVVLPVEGVLRHELRCLDFAVAGFTIDRPNGVVWREGGDTLDGPAAFEQPVLFVSQLHRLATALHRRANFRIRPSVRIGG